MQTKPVSPQEGWYPYEVIRTDDSDIQLEWVCIGSKPFTDPFYGETLARARDPQLGKRRTALDHLPQLVEGTDGAPLKGLIFHVSRCGSTLLSQWLSILPQIIMVSEPPPLDALLRMHLHVSGLQRELQVKYVRAMVKALGARRTGRETGLVIKLDCWHVWLADLLKEAFPHVPRIFVYREPAEVIRSHQRRRGSLSVPDLLEIALTGVDSHDLAPGDLDAYLDRILGLLMAAMADQWNAETDILLNYSQGNKELLRRMMKHFCLAPTDAEREMMNVRGNHHSKNAQELFVEAVDPPPIARCAQQSYAQLEQLRLARAE